MLGISYQKLALISINVKNLAILKHHLETSIKSFWVKLSLTVDNPF